jgi:hypothetical protein
MSARARSVAKTIFSLATFAVAITAANGCQSSGEATGGAACTLGDRIPCSGTDGCSGAAECLPDLSDFGDCECAGDAGTTDAAAGVDAGSRDAGEDSG